MKKEAFIKLMLEKGSKTDDDIILLDALNVYTSFLEELRDATEGHLDKQDAFIAPYSHAIYICDNHLEIKRYSQHVEIKFNGEIVDKWVIDDGKVVSSQHHLPISDELFENYLDLFS